MSITSAEEDDDDDEGEREITAVSGRGSDVSFVDEREEVEEEEGIWDESSVFSCWNFLREGGEEDDVDEEEVRAFRRFSKEAIWSRRSCSGS